MNRFKKVIFRTWFHFNLIRIVPWASEIKEGTSQNVIENAS